jgi:hypothetical protein
MSRSMHTTFDLPPDMGPKPEDLDEAYLKATAYMDSSLGIILDEVEKGHVLKIRCLFSRETIRF